MEIDGEELSSQLNDKVTTSLLIKTEPSAVLAVDFPEADAREPNKKCVQKKKFVCDLRLLAFVLPIPSNLACLCIISPGPFYHG